MQFISFAEFQYLPNGFNEHNVMPATKTARTRMRTNTETTSDDPNDEDDDDDDGINGIVAGSLSPNRT